MSLRRYFGTDGIRGVANQPPLDPETMVRLGVAIASVFLKEARRHRILIGKDTRLSGYMIETALAAGLTARGSDVLLSGPLPTPGVAYLTKSMRVDAGIVISASHNPYEDNGIKIFASDGFKLPDARELEIERLLDSPAVLSERADAQSIGKATRMVDAVGRYTVFLKSCFPRELSLEGLKIGLDCANGAAYVVGPQTLSELGADVTSRGVSPNGKNINAGFGSLYPEVMSKLVRENNLSLGISLDGDADRVIMLDEKGQPVDGDLMLALVALDAKKRGLLTTPTIVGTVMSNLGLELLLKQNGLELVRAQVGDRYVLEEMIRLGANIGGEQSGHLIFLKHASSGDGLLSALMIIAIMLREGRPLSELAKCLERFPQKLLNIKVSSKPDLNSIESIKKIIARKEKELKERGRILVRYSGTENKARVMVECEDQLQCERHASDIAQVIEKAIGIGA